MRAPGNARTPIGSPGRTKVPPEWHAPSHLLWHHRSMGIRGSHTLGDVLYRDIIPRLSVEEAYSAVTFRLRRGRYWRGACPLHGGEDANFAVDTQTLSWFCYSHCGTGSYLAFLNGGESPRGERFVELVETLAERVGVTLDTRDVPSSVSAAVHRNGVLEAFTALAGETLTLPGGAGAVAYLHSRGFSEDPAELAKLGFGAYPSPSLRAGLRVPAAELDEFGMRDPRWSNRILIPWRDEYGRITTISARSIDDSEPRYLYLRNAPLPPFFRPRRSRASGHATRVILVEGMIDALLLAAHGVDGVLATGGTSVSERHVGALVELGVQTVVLALDADEAGQAAAGRLAGLLRDGAPAIRVQVVPIAAYRGTKDPAELVERDGADAIVDFLDARLPYRVWEAGCILEGLAPASPVSRRRDALVALIALVDQAEDDERAADAEDIWQMATATLGYSAQVVRSSLGLSAEVPADSVAVSRDELVAPERDDQETLASVADASVETLATIGAPLRLTMLAHILRGSRGPMTQEIVTRYKLSRAGMLGDYTFGEVRDLVRTACSTDPRLDVDPSGPVHLVGQVVGQEPERISNGGRPWRPDEETRLEASGARVSRLSISPRCISVRSAASSPASCTLALPRIATPHDSSRWPAWVSVRESLDRSPSPRRAPTDEHHRLRGRRPAGGRTEAPAQWLGPQTMRPLLSARLLRQSGPGRLAYPQQHGQKRLSRLEAVEDQSITARLAGAAGMRAELEHVLSAVGPGEAPATYRTAILDGNAARKSTHTARDWAWKRLKLRYALDSTDTPEFRAFDRAMRDPDPAGRGLTAYLMLTRTDRLFREASLALLVPILDRLGTVIASEAVLEYVERARLDAALEWSVKSVRAVAGHTLTSWKEFGLIEGSKTRRVARLRPSHATTRFLVELARAQGLTDRQALESVWASLLGLDFQAVDAALRGAARDGVLQYRTQADVVEITLPDEA